MTGQEKVNVELFKPRYSIGQVIYIPGRCGIEGKAVKTSIIGYGITVREHEGNLIGGVTSYETSSFASVRRSDHDIMTCTQIKDGDFYLDSEKARIGSKFLEVKVDDETWKLAIGDRDADRKSPYSIENCELQACCADISEARDILNFCKKEGGLIVHNRDELKDLIAGHGGLKYDEQGPIGRIFTLLEMNHQELKLV